MCNSCQLETKRFTRFSIRTGTCVHFGETERRQVPFWLYLQGQIKDTKLGSQLARCQAWEWHLLHYSWLHNDALAKNRKQYVVQFKHHHMCHIMAHARFLNPMYVWCYPFEDSMGRLVASAKSRMAGTSQTLSDNKVMTNYLLVLKLTLRERQKQLDRR